MFYGKRRASRTVYRYNRRGRLVEAVTTDVEPEWDDRDRELALAVEDDLATRCGDCGYPLEETTDPDPLVRWEVDQAAVRMCKACAAQDSYVANKIDGDRKKHLHALKIPVRRSRLQFDDDE